MWAVRDTQVSIYPAAAIIVGDGSAETTPAESDTAPETTTTDTAEPTDPTPDESDTASAESTPAATTGSETSPASSGGCGSAILPTLILLCPAARALFCRKDKERADGAPHDHA